MNDLVKQAEQNVVNIAKSIADFYEVLDAMISFGNKYCHEYIAKNEFFEGLTKMRSALYEEWANAIVNCFTLSAVGGEEAKKYSQELYKKMFSKKDRLAVMHLLDEFGQYPHSYKEADDVEFRKQASEKIKQAS